MTRIKPLAILTVIMTLAVFTMTGCITFATLISLGLDAAQAIEIAHPNAQLETDIQIATSLEGVQASTQSGECKLEAAGVVVDTDLVQEFAPIGPAQDVASVAVAILDSAEAISKCPSTSTTGGLATASLGTGPALNNGIRGTQAYADTLAAIKTGDKAKVKSTFNGYAALHGQAGIQ